MEVLKVSYSSSDAPKNFTRSLRETGFGVLTDHPISRDLIYGTYSDWEDFFKGPSKSKYIFDPKVQSGYFPFKSENAKGYDKKDLKEFFHLYPETPLPQGLSQRSWDLYDQMSHLAAELLGWIEDHTPEDIRKRFSMPLRKMVEKSPKTLFRILHYPPLEGIDDEGAIRAAAHGDINLITLLPAATAPGLQVKNAKGDWVDVPCDPGSIVVNCGDMLQMATDGYYKSTLHQVVNPMGEERRNSRYSMPLFLHPWPEVRLSATHTADSYLNERLRELGLKA